MVAARAEQVLEARLLGLGHGKHTAPPGFNQGNRRKIGRSAELIHGQNISPDCCNFSEIDRRA